MEAATRRDSHGRGFGLALCSLASQLRASEASNTTDAAEAGGPCCAISLILLGTRIAALNSRGQGQDRRTWLSLPHFRAAFFGQSPTAASATTTSARQTRRNGYASEVRKCRTLVGPGRIIARSNIEFVSDGLVACNPLPCRPGPREAIPRTHRYSQRFSRPDGQSPLHRPVSARPIKVQQYKRAPTYQHVPATWKHIKRVICECCTPNTAIHIHM